MQNLKFQNKFTLNGILVGEGEPCFIIAEIGVNHNGSLELAKKMIDAAKEAGANCAKFQSFRTEEFMGSDVIYEYMSNGELVQESMIEMFKKLELPIQWHKELFDYCLEKNIVPMTSVADQVIAKEVFKLASDGIKLASEDLINLDLVEFVVSQCNHPLIFSTGMANEEEILDVLNLLNKYDRNNCAFLHCVSVYPTPKSEANLARMQSLKSLLGNQAIVGYSDHTEGITASVAAVAMGAKIIEKHFTIDKNLEGPDHSLSADLNEFKEMVKSIREIESLMGSPKLEPSKTEKETTRIQFRRSIVANQDIPVGKVIDKSLLAYRRPGTGLRPRERELVIGKKTNKEIKENNIITLSDVE